MQWALSLTAQEVAGAECADAPSGAFSLNLLYDCAESAGRLHAIVHDGEWFHIGTPEALAESEAELSGRTRTTDLRTR